MLNRTSLQIQNNTKTNEQQRAWENEEKFKNFTDFYKNISEDLDSVEYPRLNNLNIDEFQYSTIQKFDSKIKESASNDLKVIHVNIVGIDKNFINLINFLNSFDNFFDIIVLSECHINNHDILLPDLHNTHIIQGYNKFYVRSSRKLGGVIIYVRDLLTATYISF